MRRCTWMCVLVVAMATRAMGRTAPQVTIDTGVVEGKMEGSVRAFLGIPFAAPPVGELRWKPPAPAGKWSGVRKAKEFGSHCMQENVYGDMVFRDPGPSEDCLP